jgi:hypothetical protein
MQFKANFKNQNTLPHLRNSSSSLFFTSSARPPHRLLPQHNMSLLILTNNPKPLPPKNPTPKPLQIMSLLRILMSHSLQIRQNPAIPLPLPSPNQVPPHRKYRPPNKPNGLRVRTLKHPVPEFEGRHLGFSNYPGGIFFVPFFDVGDLSPGIEVLDPVFIEEYELQVIVSGGVACIGAELGGIMDRYGLRFGLE